MVISFFSAVIAAAAAASGCDQRQPLAPSLRADVRIQLDTTLAPIADTYVRSHPPNTVQGTSLTLQVSAPVPNRTLLMWDTAAIRQALGGGTLESARLELTINQKNNSWGPAGRAINLHRLTQAWTEAGATWHCAVDANPGNQTQDCGGATSWQMGLPASAPFVSTPTASAVITNGQTGVVSFDVSADVAALLAGTQTHYGWIVKKAAEHSTGAIRFASRESATKPRLVLALAQDTSRPALPSQVTFPDDSTRIVSDPQDTVRILYRTIASVIFYETASGSTVRAFLSKYQAQIVGGMPYSGGYIVQFPDPGPTWHALQARLNQMSAEPGVKRLLPVSRRDYAPRANGRYPSDGPNVQRSSWFVPGNVYQWARWAIRSPLAWGCETGGYSTPLPVVGVLEWLYEGARQDVGGTVFTTSQPATPLSQSNLDFFERHGNVVASVLAAPGDNDSGVAGMIWRSDLRLYALGNGSSNVPRYTNLAFVEEILAKAEKDQPSVLNVSVLFGGPPSDSAQQGYLVDNIKQFLKSSPRTLIVVASGNDYVTFTSQDLLSRNESSLGLTAAMLRVRLDPLFADRILFVSGTMQGNERWKGDFPGEGATIIEGQIGVAAPASQVAVVGLTRLGESVILRGGTSVAAPMVAGVAAQLLAFDPTLTPQQVVQYIERGALEPRLNPRTGLDSVPTEVAGIPGVYQLDAYGSLTLLSRERPGTPICGYPVRVGDDGASVVLEPSGPARPPLPVPNGEFVRGLSVAQGGRLIAVATGSDSSSRTYVMNQAGTLLSTVIGFHRQFLEKDTVDIRPRRDPPYPLVTVRRANGTVSANLDLFSATVPPGFWIDNPFGEGQVALSPAGDTAAIAAQYFASQCGSATLTFGWFFVPVAGGTARQVGQFAFDRCDLDMGLLPIGFLAPSWTHDGRRAAFIISYLVDRGNASPLTTVITDAFEGAPGLDLDVGDRYVETPRFSADDSVLTAGESSEDRSSCTLVLRSAASLAVLPAGGGPGRLGIDCFTSVGPVQPNALGRGRFASARSAPFDLGAALRPLRGRAYQSSGARVLRVQAN